MFKSNVLPWIIVLLLLSTPIYALTVTDSLDAEDTKPKKITGIDFLDDLLFTLLEFIDSLVERIK